MIRQAIFGVLAGVYQRLRFRVLARTKSPVGFFLFCLTIIATVAIIALDPFRIGQRTETVFEAAAQSLEAPFYPPQASNRIALILSTEASYQHNDLGLSFPLDWEVQANLIDFAVQSGAAAVFLDYSYLQRDAGADAGGKLQAIKRALDDARAEGVPVFSGEVNADAAFAPFTTSRSPLLRSTKVSWSSDHPGDYALFDDAGASLAATVLYEAACAEKARAYSCDRKLLKAIQTREKLPPIAVQFGSAFPQVQEKFSGDAEKVRCEQSKFRVALLAGFMGRPEASPCPHHLTIPVEAILHGQADDARDLLAGRTVIIGTGAGLHDERAIPGVGVIPGPEIHAMALDNLLTRGGDYDRWPQDFFPGLKVGWDEVLKLFALCLPAIVAPLVRRLESLKQGSVLQRHSAAILALVICASVILLPCIIGMAFWKFAHWPLAEVWIVGGVGTLMTSVFSGREVLDALRIWDSELAVCIGCAMLALALVWLLWPSAVLSLGLVGAAVLALWQPELWRRRWCGPWRIRASFRWRKRRHARADQPISLEDLS